jgi:chromosome segregation ATPase
VSIDLPDTAVGLESTQSALDGLQGAENEFNDFFGEVFDELQSLSLELFARHRCLEFSAANQASDETASTSVQARFGECLEGLRQLQAEVRAAQDETRRIWADMSSAQQQFIEQRDQMQAIQEELHRIATELGAVREDVQGKAELTRLLEATQQQQVAWQEERASLEAELAAERRRAAQQGDALAQQRHAASEQQAELAGELTRMRALLEILSKHMTPSSDANTDERGKTPPSSENAALGSVLAQFQMLQRDVAQRRSASQKKRE